MSSFRIALRQIGLVARVSNLGIEDFSIGIYLERNRLKTWRRRSRKRNLKIKRGEDVGVYGKCKAGNCHPLDTNCDRVISDSCAYYRLPIHLPLFRIRLHFLAAVGRIVLRASVGNQSSDISVDGFVASAS